MPTNNNNPRKSRLAKDGNSSRAASSSAFLGFGVFQTDDIHNNHYAEIDESTTMNNTGGGGGPSTTTVTISPVFMGTDETLRTLFTTRFSKRDAITLTKAIQELDEIYNNNHSNSTTNIPKKQLIDGLCHYAYWFHTKFVYDANPSVRAAALRFWIHQWNTFPKAITILVTQKQIELLGMIYTLAMTDPALEVRNVILVNDDDNQAPWNSFPSIEHWERGILAFAKRILSYPRASAMHQALFPTRNKKNTTNQSNKTAVGQEISDAEKEEREERYERLVGGCLDSLSQWIRQHYHSTKNDHSAENNNKYTSTTTTSPLSMMMTTSPHENEEDQQQFTGWWKTWNSSKPTLRRKTYQLLGTVMQSRLSSSPSSTTTVLLPSNLEKLLVQALSTEAQSSNIPILLETVLSVLHKQQQEQHSSSLIVSTTALLPSLNQQFQNACHGASVREWAPTILVFVSLLAKNDHGPSTKSIQGTLLSLIQAVEQGTRHVRGPAEQIRLQTYLAETASWITLMDPKKLFANRSPDNNVDSNDDDWYLELAKVWLRIWYAALEHDPNGMASLVEGVHRQQSRELATQLVKFEQQTMTIDDDNTSNTNTSNRGGAFQKSEFANQFWNHLVDLSPSSFHPSALAEFVQELKRIQHSQTIKDGSNSKFCSHLVPKLREKFYHVLRPYEQSSGVVPTQNVYRLMQAVLEYCGPPSIFVIAIVESGDLQLESSNATMISLERFVMNDLLRWTILHTSSLSDPSFQSADFARQDFRLFGLCQDAIPKEQQSSIWRAFLREILAAKCEIQSLVAGLHVIVQNSKTQQDWIVCDELNEFSCKISRSYPNYTETETHSSTAGGIPNQHDDEASVESTTSHFASETYKNHLEFFLTCVCIDEPSKIIVTSNTIAEWTEAISPSARTGMCINFVDYEGRYAQPVLEALLRVIRSKQSLLDDKTTDRIIMEAWRGAHHLFEKHALKIFQTRESLFLSFVSLASEESRRELDWFNSNNSYRASQIKLWTLKAWRLLQAARETSGVDTLPALDLGFQEVLLWKKHPKSMFDLSMSLLEKLTDPQCRWALLKSWCRPGSNFVPEYLSTILISLSEANSLEAYAYRPRDREDRCALFLSAIGGEPLCEVLDELLDTITERIKSFFDETDSNSFDTLQRSVAVMSQLFDLTFQRVAPLSAAIMNPKEIAEGDRLWYIVDPSNPKKREEVTVAKVHYESQAGYYFTIRCHPGLQERQTVIERLRRDQQSDSFDGCIIADCISALEWERRSQWCKSIVHDVIVPRFSPDKPLESWGEIVHLILSQVGIGVERGIGSDHYAIYRCVKSLEEALIRNLHEDNKYNEVGRQLRVLSLALGYGLNTPSSKWTLQQINLDPVSIFEVLIETYSSLQVGEREGFDCAVMEWFVVSRSTAQDCIETKYETAWKLLLLIFRIAAKYLHPENVDAVSLSNFMIACKAMHEGLLLYALFQSTDNEEQFSAQLALALQTAFSHLVNSMTIEWASISHEQSTCDQFHDVLMHTDFPRLVQSVTQMSKVMNLLAAAISKNADVLVKLLFDPRKRHFAFLLLDSIAIAGTPLRTADEVERIISEHTCRQLQIWSAGLEEEEAAEVEEDVFIVAEWVPILMMETIERWVEHDYEEVDASTTIGMFLTWLSFLRFVESAGPINFRNRPAFVSYAGKCGAVHAILNVAVLQDEYINDKMRKKFPGNVEFGQMLREESDINVARLSSLCLFRTVEILPSLSRRWWEEECPKVYSNPVQQFVEKYVSPEILKRELDRIKSNSTFGQMSVNAALISREVTATYVQDDFTLRVSISLPTLFPFRNAEVDCSKTLGVPQNRWKLWSLQITLMLNSQGGTLLDALTLWKDNVDKEFEGVEPCPVCYSVLHVKTHKLPSLECKTCHNRFHFDCLTQWFRSSGKSQCVLCQQPWQGTRI